MSVSCCKSFVTNIIRKISGEAEQPAPVHRKWALTTSGDSEAVHTSEYNCIVLVKESGDLALQLGRVTQLTHGNGVFKEFALEICGQIVPLHDDCGPEAAQICSSSLASSARAWRCSCGAPLGAPPSLSHLAIALF